MVSRNLGLGGIAVLGLLASACMSQQVAVVQPAPAPARVVVPAVPQIIHKTAIAGQATKLDFSNSLNPDCSVRSIPTIRIVEQPMHGTVQVLEREDYPLFAPNNIHFVCDKNKVKGAAADYIPAPGYLGPDQLTMEILNDEGSDHTYRIAITVK